MLSACTLILPSPSLESLPLHRFPDLRLANLAYLSLWHTSGREYGFYDEEWQMVGGAAAADSVIVASEPLTSDITRWLEVPEYSTLHTERDNGRAVTNIHYIDV